MPAVPHSVSLQMSFLLLLTATSLGGLCCFYLWEGSHGLFRDWGSGRGGGKGEGKWQGGLLLFKVTSFGRVLRIHLWKTLGICFDAH